MVPSQVQLFSSEKCKKPLERPFSATSGFERSLGPIEIFENQRDLDLVFFGLGVEASPDELLVFCWNFVGAVVCRKPRSPVTYFQFFSDYLHFYVVHLEKLLEGQSGPLIGALLEVRQA